MTSYDKQKLNDEGMQSLLRRSAYKLLTLSEELFFKQSSSCHRELRLVIDGLSEMKEELEDNLGYTNVGLADEQELEDDSDLDDGE